MSRTAVNLVLTNISILFLVFDARNQDSNETEIYRAIIKANYYKLNTKAFADVKLLKLVE